MDKGPWVIGAFFCSEVVERDMVSNFVAQGNEAWVDKDEVPSDFVFTVMIAGGDPGQRVKLQLFVNTPWGEVLGSEPETYEMLGTTWILHYVSRRPPFLVREMGTYWVSVFLDDEFKVASPFVFKRSPNL